MVRCVGKLRHQSIENQGLDASALILKITTSFGHRDRQGLFSAETLTSFESHWMSGKGKGKGKAVPLQAWSGPEGSRKLMFPDYMTTAQDGGKVVSLTHQPPLPSGNIPSTHFC
jgi:hypothetical protein